MAHLEDLGVFDLVERLIQRGKTHKAIADDLRRLFPDARRGTSPRSVRRFCAKHHLHTSSRLSEQAVDVLVAYGIGMVKD